MQTLAVHCGGVGDFILSLPALEHLAQSGALDLLGYPERLELAVAAGEARSATHVDRVDFHTAFTSPSPALRNFLQTYERIVVWMSDDDGTLAAGLRSAFNGEVHVFPGLPPDDWTGHACDYVSHCVGRAPGAIPAISLPAAKYSHDVLVHPGSGSKKKNWPLENFVSLTQKLREHGHEVTWILGPAEEAMGGPPEIKILSAISLVTLGQHLHGARLYLGNDSGITHLAAAVGCSTIALFGPTDPARWAPRGDRVQVLQHPAVDEVLHIARTTLQDP